MKTPYSAQIPLHGALVAALVGVLLTAWPAAAQHMYTNKIMGSNGLPQCLAVSGGHIANGSPLIIWDCVNDPSQTFYQSNDNTLRIGSANSPYCVAAFDTVKRGTRIGVWQCVPGHPTQKLGWNRDLFFLGSSPKLCLGVQNASPNRGTPIIGWECTDSGNDNQAWVASLPGGAPPAAPPQPTAIAKTAKNGWSQMGNQWERCFGAVGPGCDGAPGADVVKNADGSITAYVAVGSILHDNCCLRNGPGGVWCGGVLKGVAYDEASLAQRLVGHCSQEWSKAVYNVRDRRVWRVIFPAYHDSEGGDDLTQTSNRHAKLSVANSPLFVDYTGGETSASRALAAPAGTALDIDDEAFCASGRFRERHDLWVGQGRWGVCQ
jgi:hypothetical protein